MKVETPNAVYASRMGSRAGAVDHVSSCLMYYRGTVGRKCSYNGARRKAVDEQVNQSVQCRGSEEENYVNQGVMAPA